MYVCAESIFVIMEPSLSKLEPWISKLSNLKNVTFLQNTIAEQKRDKIKEKKLINPIPAGGEVNLTLPCSFFT